MQYCIRFKVEILAAAFIRGRRLLLYFNVSCCYYPRAGTMKAAAIKPVNHGNFTTYEFSTIKLSFTRVCGIHDKER